MPLWKENGLYRIQFQYLGKRYSKQRFPTKKAAERWQAEKLKELEQENQTPTIKKNLPASSAGGLIKMKRQQNPIYMAVKDWGISIPLKEEVPAPPAA